MESLPKRVRNKPVKFEPYSPGDKHKLNADRTKKSKELKKDRERKKNKSNESKDIAGSTKPKTKSKCEDKSTVPDNAKEKTGATKNKSGCQGKADSSNSKKEKNNNIV